MRLRHYGTSWTLTHKAPAGTGGRYKSRLEREVRVADGTALEEILKALGFVPVFRYEKFRSEWSDGQGHVVLDRTPIGDYGEIEGQPRWIDTLARQLGIPSSNYITVSYGELFQQWRRRNHSQAAEMTFRSLARRRPRSARK